jgi:F-type H+-transporting ATPase subunit a
MVMDISPDATVFAEWGFVTINATLVFTWAVMAVLVLFAWLATRRLSIETQISRWQSFLETIVSTIRAQIEDITQQTPERYVPFLGTLFLFISVSNLLAVVPLYEPPTGSFSTTAALAICVFFAVPIFGITERGTAGYFRHYIRPSPLMAPFHIMSELSRTLALAVRLFGNVMSGTMIIAILVSIVPFFLPVIMQALELLIGQIQAYIFAVLGAVYIASATRAREDQEARGEGAQKGDA